jgi:hypothetical protein
MYLLLQYVVYISASFIWSAKEAANGANLTSKWHPTTKGTLRRNYRVPSKSEGRRLLKSIASLLSDDDHFVDATSHKVCNFPMSVSISFSFLKIYSLILTNQDCMLD